MARYRLTESKLRGIIREEVENILIEEKLDNPIEALKYMDEYMSSFDFNFNIEDDIAQLLVDNDLTINDLKQYPNIIKRINLPKLRQEIENYNKFLAWWDEDEKRREHAAWAEEQMSNMGFGFEGD